MATERTRATLFGIVCLALLSGWGCRNVQRYRLAAPIWSDPDRNHLPKQPKEFYSGLYADALNQTLLRPLSDLAWVTISGESKNVNAMDEVPDSSWFTNRIGVRPVTPERAAVGPCTGTVLDPDKGPWLIKAAKTEGVTPGFFIKAPDGQRYLLKFDGWHRPERASAADTLGARFYWTAGYFAPCNFVVYFKRDILTIAPDATAENDRGQKEPMVPNDVAKVLKRAPMKGNLLRGLASRFVPGKPIGPHPWSGGRSDDPNDIIPHEDRRELRAERLFAAWLNHFDIREQNSLDVFVKEGGRGYVRHYMLDFGDSFGSPWTEEQLNRRVGYSYYLDLQHIFVDLITLGAYPRPWWAERINDEIEIFGHYRWENFDPTKWRSMYPHPAYERMTWRDALWITRIIARFTDDHIRAIVKTGKLSRRDHEEYLVRALIERRNRILRKYLGQHVPLHRFVLAGNPARGEAQRLCFEDLGVRYAGIDPKPVVYKLRVLGHEHLDRLLGWQQWQPDTNGSPYSCIELPFQVRRPYQLAPKNAPDDHPMRYALLKIYVFERPPKVPTLVALHTYDLGPKRGLRLVGVERLPRPVKSKEFYDYSLEDDDDDWL